MTVTDRETGTRQAQRWLRGWTIGLGWGAVAQGAWAFFWPRRFYEDFPLEGAQWVSTLGPFNEHLTKDVGTAVLGLGVAAVVAGRSGRLEAIRAVCTGYVVFGVAHLGFHFGELGHFSVAAATAQIVSLVMLVVIPAALSVAATADRRGWGR